MGTHPNGPSLVVNSDSSEKQSLASWINTHQGCLGGKVTEGFEGKLPFLLKVLSVNKSLSIQAHPNKQYAEELHSERPEIYKDSNHKPEMAIGISQLWVSCGKGRRWTGIHKLFLVTSSPLLPLPQGDQVATF